MRKLTRTLVALSVAGLLGVVGAGTVSALSLGWGGKPAPCTPGTSYCYTPPTFETWTR